MTSNSTQARTIAGLATFAALDFALGSLVQARVVDRLPDPPLPRFDSRAVMMSRAAWPLGIPDAPIALGLQAGILLLIGARSRASTRGRRWIDHRLRGNYLDTHRYRDMRARSVHARRMHEVIDMATSSTIAERIAFGRPLDRTRDIETPHAVPRPGTILLGRILIATIFMISGVTKLLNIDQTAAHMTSEGIPAAGTLVFLAAFAEIAGGAAILFGFLTRIGAIGLILFMIPTTLVFHDFWTFSGEEQRMQMIQFLKNLTIIGGLSLLVAHGAGRYSIDAKLRAPKPA
jgi:putative oxidoreductase